MSQFKTRDLKVAFGMGMMVAVFLKAFFSIAFGTGFAPMLVALNGIGFIIGLFLAVWGTSGSRYLGQVAAASLMAPVSALWALYVFQHYPLGIRDKVDGLTYAWVHLQVHRDLYIFPILMFSGALLLAAWKPKSNETVQ